MQNNVESKNPKFSKTKNGKIMLYFSCEVCDCKKPKFIKEQEVSGLMSQLGIRYPLSKVPLCGDILFYMFSNEQHN